MFDFMQICTTSMNCQKPRQFRWVLLCLTLIAISCNKGPDFVTKYGDEITITKEVTGNGTLFVSQKFDLYLLQNSSQKEFIQITYGSNLVDKIAAEVEDGVFKVKDQNKYNWVRNLNVRPRCTLNLHSLQNLHLEGTSNLTCLDSIQTSNLSIKMDGVGVHSLKVNCGSISGSCSNSGGIAFSGRGGLFAWSCEDGGWIDASNMYSDDVYFYHYTDRDVYINPNVILVSYVYGNGNVFYKKKPWMKFEIKETGNGKVIQK